MDCSISVLHTGACLHSKWFLVLVFVVTHLPRWWFKEWQMHLVPLLSVGVHIYYGVQAYCTLEMLDQSNSNAVWWLVLPTFSLQFRLNINDQDGLHLLYQELYRLGVFMNDDFTIDDFGDPYVPCKYDWIECWWEILIHIAFDYVLPKINYNLSFSYRCS